MPKAEKKPVSRKLAVTKNKPAKTLVIKSDKALIPVSTEAPSKRTTLISLLSRAEGATLDEMMSATGWQRHSVRGAISGVIRKRLCYRVVLERTERGSVYRIAA